MYEISDELTIAFLCLAEAAAAATLDQLLASSPVLQKLFQKSGGRIYKDLRGVLLNQIQNSWKKGLGFRISSLSEGADLLTKRSAVCTGLMDESPYFFIFTKAFREHFGQSRDQPERFLCILSKNILSRSTTPH